MFNPDNIRAIYYKEYEKLVDLFKKNGPTQEKYLELKSILEFFSKNQDNLNDDESKLLKNILIMADGILNSAVPNRKQYKDQKDDCKKLCILMKTKNLPE